MFHLKKKKSSKVIEDLYRKTSYSQCGEDILVKYIFYLRGIIQPTYLDIGCNHPFYLNNTAIFYEAGCRGINIDANPALIGKFKDERKEDTNLNYGIGENDKELDFYILSDDTLSTFSKEEADYIVSLGKVSVQSIEKVKLASVKKILDKYNNGVFPDFLSIDVEGLDLQILQSINYDLSAPKVICVEAAEYSSIGAGKRKDDLIDFLVSKDYYEYANTNLNAIMVKNEFWFI